MICYNGFMAKTKQELNQKAYERLKRWRALHPEKVKFYRDKYTENRVKFDAMYHRKWRERKAIAEDIEMIELRIAALDRQEAEDVV